MPAGAVTTACSKVLAFWVAPSVVTVRLYALATAVLSAIVIVQLAPAATAAQVLPTSEKGEASPERPVSVIG